MCDPRFTEAVDRFTTWFRNQPAGEGDIGQLCAEHPTLAEELRKLHSVAKLAQSLVGSASFPQSIRQLFGDEAQITLAIEEGEITPTKSPESVTGTPAAPSDIDGSERYELVGEVGRGGMGIIYRVRDRELNRTLAMKVLLGAASTSPPMGQAGGRQVLRSPGAGSTSQPLLARFLEEAQITAQLDHPGIVAVHELGLDQAGRPYFTMKLVKGRDLSRIFELARGEQEGWNLPRAVGALVRACQAVAFAHTKGVLHRDLKAANIMVGRFGEVYVMDWGLAKVTGRKDLHDIRVAPGPRITVTEIQTLRTATASSTADSPLITMDGSVVGTPAYMPPEQARGQVEQVDRQSDIYSLGAILYSLLSGQAPYVEPGARLSPHTILARVLDGPPKRVHLLNSQASPELIAICEKAMAREKRDRYESSLDLAEDLQAYLDHRVVKAYRTGALAEFKSWVARNRTTALVTTSAVALVMGLLFFGAVWERAKAFRLKESLACQYLHRGQALCEQGEMAHGLHWLARSLKEAPEQSVTLRDVIQQNLASWAERWRSPQAILVLDSIVNGSALSPDGKRVVTCNNNGLIQFWSAETGEALPLRWQLDGVAFAFVFSPDGGRLFTIGETVRIWNSQTGEPIGSPMKHELPSWVDLSPDGRRVATARGDGVVQLWSAATGERMGARMVHGGAVSKVAFNADGHLLVTCSDDKTARLWNGATGEPVGSLLQHPDRVWGASFSPEGNRLATVCGDGNLRLWNPGTGQPMGAPIMHPGMRGIAFSPDSQRLATWGQDRTVRFWNPLTGETMGAPLMHDHTASDAVFKSDGHQILTASTDGAVRLWLVETGKLLGTPLRHERGYGHVILSKDGQTVLLSVFDCNAVGLWRVKAEDHPVVAFPRDLGLKAVTFTSNGQRLLAGDERGGLWWCSTQTGEAVRSTLHHDGQIWSVALSRNGRRALTSSGDKTARLWSLEEGERLLWTVSHESDVRAAVFSPDEHGRLVATASFDRTVRLWSADTGQPVGNPLRHPNGVEDVAFSPDGTLLATACGDGAARLWSVKTGQPVGREMRHRSPLLGVTFSPDGKQLVTASRDKTARFWTVATRQPTGRVLEHLAGVDDVQFSPDGKRLVTGSTGEDSIRLWSTETGELLGPPFEESTFGDHVAFSPDGTRIAAAREGNPTRLWTIPPPFQGDLRYAELRVQVLTWQEMDANGVLTWLDHETWRARRDQLEKLSGPAITGAR